MDGEVGLGALQQVGVLEVHERDAASIGQVRLAVVLVGEAHAVGGGLLSQQRVLPPIHCLHVLLHG